MPQLLIRLSFTVMIMTWSYLWEGNRKYTELAKKKNVSVYLRLSFLVTKRSDNFAFPIHLPTACPLRTRSEEREHCVCDVIKVFEVSM